MAISRWARAASATRRPWTWPSTSATSRARTPRPTPNDPYAGERKSPSLLDLQTLEQQAIQRALEYTGGNVSEAARRLGIGRTTLYRKMAAYGLVPPA